MCIVAYPVLICILLITMQTLINNEIDNPKYQCGCTCIPVNGTGTCQKVCGPQYSTMDQVGSCAIDNPPEWSALMQVPRPEFRAARDVYLPSADLPDWSCRLSGSCPATVFFTSQNQTLAKTLAGSLFPVLDSSSPNFSNYITLFSRIVPVVYMDELSTGLDPASRNNLWNVVKHAKKDRAIILTSNPKELKARYGGSYVFTMTTSADQEQEVETLVWRLSPNARKIYHISGTQKFEIPKQEVRISDVFQAVEKAKSRFSIYTWGLADTTLEDIFIKVAKGAKAFNVLS